jgi:hypothetical protein
MLRALFLRELRKSWLVHAGLFAVAFGTATLLEQVSRGHFLSPEDEISLSNFLIAGLALSGLISGERCFPKAFKEGHYAFLLTLPRPRGGIWLAYLGGRLIGALAALPMAFLAKPSMISQLLIPEPAKREPPISWADLGPTLTVYLVLFFGGACLALAFRRRTYLYLAAVPLFGFLGFAILASASYGFHDPMSPQAEIRWEYYVFCAWLLLGPLMAVACRRAFCRGEFHLGQRRWRSLAESGLAVALHLGAISVLFSSVGFAALTDRWAAPAPSSAWSLYGPESPVSSDGRFLFLAQRLRDRPEFTRLTVIDLQTGESANWMRRSIYRVAWSAAGDILNVLAANDAPSDWVASDSTDWLRLTRDLHVLSRHRFDGMWSLHPLRDGHLLLMSENGRDNIVYWLSDENGGFRESLRETLELSPREWNNNLPRGWLWHLDRGTVVGSLGSSGVQVTWLDSEGRVIRKATHPASAFPMYLLDGGQIASPQEATSELRRRFLPSAASLPRELRLRPASLTPYLPMKGGPLGLYPESNSPGPFFLEHHEGLVDVWRLDPRHGTWTRILSGITHRDFQKWSRSWQERRIYQWSHLQYEAQGQDEPKFSSPFDFDSATGTWVAAFGSGNGRLLVYDERLGQIVPNTVGCGHPEKGEVELKSVKGLKGLLVQLTCPGTEGGRMKIYHFLEHRPGSGRLRELSWHSAAVPPDLFDRWLYLDPNGISVWVSKTGEVWRVGPGQKPLRLNPPEPLH